ncbi:MAG: carbohydrate ABC transporter permease [Clostridia bacterium]|nr:carbohydrate ABC transporter permease [Clostridia bacterium]
MSKRKKINDEVPFILKHRTRGEKILYAFVFFILFIWALTFLIPGVWLVIQSLHDQWGYYVAVSFDGPFAIPDVLHFENYIKTFSMLDANGVNYGGMLLNTLWYMVLAIFYCPIWTVITSYVFSKYKFRGREFLYALIIFAMVIPIVGTGGARYKLIADLKLDDSGPLYVLATGIGGFSGSFLIMYGIFKNISWSYAEAVFIDGGGHFTAFLRIMLPQALPAISVLLLDSAIDLWNESHTFIMYLPSTPTIATGLYYAQAAIKRFGYPLYYAGIVMSIVPPIIVFAINSDFMMRSLSIGGLKG